VVGSGIFIESEMALFFECMEKSCRNMLDTADIVRDACLRHLRIGHSVGPVPAIMSGTQCAERFVQGQPCSFRVD
jgi:hypothetical protein